MVGPVLIVGAGVAGMTAAVELADAGVHTVLVERLSTVGGNALRLYKAFPTDDCFFCFEGNRWRPGIRKCFYRSALTDQPNIDLRVNTTVVDISGTPGSFTVRLRTEPTYVDPKKCILCGLCTTRSEAFKLSSPQCQPQTVSVDPTLLDDEARRVASECPTHAIDLDATPSEDTLVVSDIVIATGYHEFKPQGVQEYGYGEHPNIITQLELAEMLDPTGPSGGVLLRPSDGAPVERVMMVQCVGSRSVDHFPFCSKICCVFALKHANIIAQEHNGIRVDVVYMDIRTYDRHERYYRMARRAGVGFIRGRVSRVVPRDDGRLDVVIYDSLLDQYLQYEVDLFVLSSALEPSEGTAALISQLGLQDRSGFVAPVEDGSVDGVMAGDHVFVCGTALGPAEVPESVTQARAVVSRILQGGV